MKKQYVPASKFTDVEPWIPLKEARQNHFYDKIGPYEVEGYQMSFTPNDAFFDVLRKRIGNKIPMRADVCYKQTIASRGAPKSFIILAVNHNSLTAVVEEMKKLEGEVAQALHAEKLAACYADTPQ